MTNRPDLSTTAVRRCGLAAVVLAIASIPLAPLNALARMQTDSGRSDLANDLAAWWAEALGGVAVDHDEHGYSWVEQIPNCPWESFDYAGVPEPKTVKNRLHIDVTTDDLEALVAHGATVLRAQGDSGLGWTVLADPHGNEFCAFTG